MNRQFQQWFSEGKAVEALCGLGEYFVPDITYREEHDFVLAVGELFGWARQGHWEDAARALELASMRLLDVGQFENALRLLRSYFVLQKEKSLSLAIDERLLASRFAKAAEQHAKRLSQDESLRKLLLLVSDDLPLLKELLGIK